MRVIVMESFGIFRHTAVILNSQMRSRQQKIKKLNDQQGHGRRRTSGGRSEFFSARTFHFVISRWMYGRFKVNEYTIFQTKSDVY